VHPSCYRSILASCKIRWLSEGFAFSFLAFSAESNAFLFLLLYHLLHQGGFQANFQ
jgi:hypothetical protein